MERESGPPTTPEQPSLQDSLVEEELETNQPLVVNTVPVLDIQPNRDNLEREESVLVQRFLSEGCGCDLANVSCSSIFTAESLESYRSQCKELSRAELDMAILGQLSASTNISTLSIHSTQYRHAATARKRTYMSFYHGGRRVCKNMFLFLHTISDTRLRNLQQSLRENGLTPRRHGNTRRLPANTVSFADTQRVVEFLYTYAEANAILLPGRIPGYKRTDTVF